MKFFYSPELGNEPTTIAPIKFSNPCSLWLDIPTPWHNNRLPILKSYDLFGNFNNSMKVIENQKIYLC